MARTPATAVEPIIIPSEPAMPRFGGGGPPDIAAEPPLSNGRLAVILFITGEAMLFTALLGPFILFRISSLAWPPVGQPYLPIAVTSVNTLVLLISGLAMNRAVAAARADRLGDLRQHLTVAAILGAAFLAVQGAEWVRLIRHGLTLSSSLYGTTFYMLIGLHGLHVLGAVVWLAVVLAAAWRGREAAGRAAGVEICAIYWYFVCALWVVLFAMVYIS